MVLTRARSSDQQFEFLLWVGIGAFLFGILLLLGAMAQRAAGELACAGMDGGAGADGGRQAIDQGSAVRGTRAVLRVRQLRVQLSTFPGG